MLQKLDHREQRIALEELLGAVRQESERVERLEQAIRDAYKVSSGPEVLPHEVRLFLSVYPSKVDRTLPLDEPDHLRHRIFRRDRDHHVDVVS
jgi:hypothetical protein